MSTNRSWAMGWIPSFLRPWVARVQRSQQAHRLARGALWLMVGTLISQGCQFVAVVLVARTLGKVEFGELGVIQSTVGMFGVFAGFGLGVTATKHVAEYRQEDPAKAGRILTMCAAFATAFGGVLTAALFLAAPWLSATTLSAPHLGTLLQVSAPLLFLQALTGAQTGALAGFEAFRSIARVNALAGLTKLPLMVGGVYVAGLSGAVWGLVASAGVHWTLTHLALRRAADREGVPFAPLRACSREWQLLYRFSLPAVLSGAIVSPVQWLNIAMLVNQPGGYAELGKYNAAVVFQGVMLFLGGVVNTPMLSMLANSHSSSKKSLNTVNIVLSWGLGILMALPLAAFPELLKIVYGQDFDDTSFRHIFVAIIFFTSIIVYKEGLARAVIASSRIWWSFLSNVTWGALAVCGMFLMVKLGALGLALAYGAAYILSTAIFVPFYLQLGLVPRDTLISFEATIIWFAIGIVTTASILEVSLVYRVGIFLASMCLTVLAFGRLLGLHRRETLLD